MQLSSAAGKMTKKPSRRLPSRKYVKSNHLGHCLGKRGGSCGGFGAGKGVPVLLLLLGAKHLKSPPGYSTRTCARGYGAQALPA